MEDWRSAQESLAELGTDTKPRVIASEFAGRRLNGPNDLALGPDGWLSPWLLEWCFSVKTFEHEK